MTKTLDLLTTTEVSEITGWSVTSVNRWALAGDLPYAHKLPGRTGSYLFERVLIEERVRFRKHAGGLVDRSAA